MAERKRRQLDPRTPLEVEQVEPAHTPRPREMPPLELGPPWFGSVRHRQQVDALWLLVAGTMTASGLLFFGWRAGVSILIVVACAVSSYLLIGQLLSLLRRNHRGDGIPHAITLALMLAVSLPLLHEPEMLILGSVLLGIISHAVGRSHRVRIHPVAVVMVLLWLAPTILSPSGVSADRSTLLKPVSAVLRPHRLLIGDVTDHPDHASTQTWSASRATDQYDAVARPDLHTTLVNDQHRMLEPSFLVNMLAGGELPRLEEVLLGVVPGPIGATSRALMILLGLYLMYRRVAWWPMGLAAIIGALMALHLMPFEQDGQTTIVAAKLLELDMPVAVSYMGYMMLGSPLLLIALVLAPMSAPMSGPGRIVYGLLIGALLITAQWMLRSPQAAFLSLLIASVLSRPLDGLHSSPFTRSSAQ